MRPSGWKDASGTLSSPTPAGRLLAFHVRPANAQNCHGAVPLLASLRTRFPSVTHILAGPVYRGSQLLKTVASTGS